MPTNQLDVFLVMYNGEAFVQWAKQLELNLCGDVNPMGVFLHTDKKARHPAFEREVPLVLYLLDVQSMRASIGFYASFTPKTVNTHNRRVLYLEELMDVESMRRWGEGFPPKAVFTLDFIDTLKRAYKYLHADLGFMDYETTDEDMHRIIMPHDSYTKLQQLGSPVLNLPFAVTGLEETELKLVPFNIDFASRSLKPTADYRKD